MTSARQTALTIHRYTRRRFTHHFFSHMWWSRPPEHIHRPTTSKVPGSSPSGLSRFTPSLNQPLSVNFPDGCPDGARTHLTCPHVEWNVIFVTLQEHLPASMVEPARRCKQERWGNWSNDCAPFTFLGDSLSFSHIWDGQSPLPYNISSLKFQRTGTFLADPSVTVQIRGQVRCR